MKTELFYTAPQAELFLLRVEHPFTLSNVNAIDRTETLFNDDDEMDL